MSQLLLGPALGSTYPSGLLLHHISVVNFLMQIRRPDQGVWTLRHGVTLSGSLQDITMPGHSLCRSRNVSPGSPIITEPHGVLIFLWFKETWYFRSCFHSRVDVWDTERRLDWERVWWVVTRSREPGESRDTGAQSQPDPGLWLVRRGRGRPLIGQMRTWKSVTDQTCRQLVTITNINSQFHQMPISIRSRRISSKRIKMFLCVTFLSRSGSMWLYIVLMNVSTLTARPQTTHATF